MKKNSLLTFLLVVATTLFCQNPKTIIESFRQGDKKARNCTSIAVIKAAIANYGVNGVFNRVEETADRYQIVLKNGEYLELLKSEENTANLYDHFVPQNDEALYKAARFMYAVMAKQKMIKDNKTDIRQVLVHRVGLKFGLLFLNADTDANIVFLGLDKNYHVLPDVTKINGLSNSVIASDHHSVYSDKGFYDEYGSMLSNGDYKSKHDENVNYAVSFF